MWNPKVNRFDSQRWSSSSRHCKRSSSPVAQLVAIDLPVQLTPTASVRREDIASDCGGDGGGVRVGGDSGYYSCKPAMILYFFAMVCGSGCGDGLRWLWWS
ncbi:Hypothetical predicted protein [Olea europaea subsp. europaea]|uniref:Uncharacterized protein n=1 Tax=Olea europaea subsp. europaea TaxID=158383 RepID=A0A8S0V2T8_OLEEU|nr:Hypothetical predicted protein [Olea europaea subsp. europaea]